MKFIKTFESKNNDKYIEDVVDLIYYRLEEEFEGNFFPLKVIANEYKGKYSITVLLGPGIDLRLGGKNENWILNYLDYIQKEKELGKYSCYIASCAMSSSEDNCFYEIQNQCWPENSHFDMLGGYSFEKLPTKRKSKPTD